MRAVRSAAVLALASLAPFAPGQTGSYANFESPTVHPIRLSADGTRLYAANTPDNRLSVWSLADPSSPVLIKEIPVGLEPVSVAPRTDDEVWVVNHLGDSVSVVSVALGVVLDTIYVKDEPADVVFAGSPQRAFVSVSQSNEVRVFDVATRDLLQTIPIFGEDPRALAASADGSKVWAVVTESGNKTTVLPASQSPAPPPPTNPALPAAPQTALIVSSTDPLYAALIPYTLADQDVVEIDANTGAILSSYTGVGTINFGIAPRPGTSELWVANTEARNLVRFVPNLRGHAVDDRVTRIVPGSPPTTTPFDLNPGVDYAVLPNPAALSTALAQPVDLVWDPSGTTLYVAAFGTDRIGVVSPSGGVTDRIEIGPAPGASADPRNKKGPRGLAHHPSQPRLYVLDRLSQTLQTIDTVSRTVLGEKPIAAVNPEPPAVREGRGFLYDAKLSGSGTMSCASCHVDSNFDRLAWDLGDPGGSLDTVANPVLPSPVFLPSLTMHPMKGPMTTQALKGLSGVDPFHWRGDRVDLAAFNGAFPDILGGAPLPSADLLELVAFLGSVRFPPNPNRTLDDDPPGDFLGGNPVAGQTFFSTQVFNGTNLRCIDCHALPTGTGRSIAPAGVLQQSQPLKAPHLRNLYEKTGFSRAPGPQRAGFGFAHDGTSDTLLGFLQQPFFGALSGTTLIATTNRQDLQALVLTLGTGTAPAVGYSRTVTGSNAFSSAVSSDFALLSGQAALGKCDLVAKGALNGQARGFRYSPASAMFLPDRSGESPSTWNGLRIPIAMGAGTLTLIGVPPGSGQRIGIDRDEDGILDGDEGLLSYGASTPGCAGPLSLGGNSEPRVGNSLFALACAGGPSGGSGLLLLGFGPTSIPVLGVTLLVDLGGVAPVALPMPADGAGLGLVSLPIPDVASLAGANLYAQAFFGDPCGPQGIGASQGLGITVQS
ncbi:MAG TPA: hypothetical protein VFI25_02640 [Planctomycetota bacterium]|jgi:DNA-binding beta-propeller fold protein YncE|nr:hypothetical protein [Planctomycetota bacterium]